MTVQRIAYFIETIFLLLKMQSFPHISPPWITLRPAGILSLSKTGFRRAGEQIRLLRQLGTGFPMGTDSYIFTYASSASTEQILL